MGITLPIPPDSALDPDDSAVKGAGIADTRAGQGKVIGFLTTAQIACGTESGIAFPDGIIGIPDCRITVTSGIFNIYNGQLSQIATVTLGTPNDSVLSGVTCDRKKYFYVMSSDGSDVATLYKIDKKGNIIQTWPTFDTNVDSNGWPVGVTRDNKFFYYMDPLDSTKIKQLNLITSAVSVVATIALGSSTDICVGPDGCIYLHVDGGTGIAIIAKYDESFTFISSALAGPTGYRIDHAHLSSDDQHIFAWTQKNNPSPPPSGLSNFRKIRLSDLAIISDSGPVLTESNSTIMNPATTISNSCPLIITGIPNEAKEDCGGGALDGQATGGGSSGNNSPGCVSCNPATAPPIDDGGWTNFSIMITGAGATNCWDTGILAAIEGQLQAKNKSLQRGTPGNIRGRIYEGYPVSVADYNKYADTNGPGCGWKISNHGLTFN